MGEKYQNPEPTAMNRPASVMRILVADELDIVRVGLRILLSSHLGWNICAEATNGREAVERAIQSRPNIGVLDVNLPELNGLEAARRIRRALPGTEIILLSMDNSERLAREAFDAGAHILLPKTDAKRLLVSTVESVAQHKFFFSTQAPEFVAPTSPEPAVPWLKTRRPRSRLTPREREIVQLVVEGRTNKEIAAMLVRSVKTVETHRANVMNKLGLQGLTELVRYAIRNKIVEG